MHRRCSAVVALSSSEYRCIVAYITNCICFCMRYYIDILLLRCTHNSMVSIDVARLSFACLMHIHTHTHSQFIVSDELHIIIAHFYETMFCVEQDRKLLFANQCQHESPIAHNKFFGGSYRKHTHSLTLRRSLRSQHRRRRSGASNIFVLNRSWCRNCWCSRRTLVSDHPW